METKQHGTKKKKINESVMKSKWKLKYPLRQMTMETHPYKSYGVPHAQSQREAHSDTGLSQKQEKSQINHLSHHIKDLGKEEQTKPEVSRKKEIIIRSERK